MRFYVISSPRCGNGLCRGRSSWQRRGYHVAVGILRQIPYPHGQVLLSASSTGRAGRLQHTQMYLHPRWRSTQPTAARGCEEAWEILFFHINPYPLLPVPSNLPPSSIDKYLPAFSLFYENADDTNCFVSKTCPALNAYRGDGSTSACCLPQWLR